MLITRGELSDILCADMQTETIHSYLTYNTDCENEPIHDNWIVTLIRQNDMKKNLLTIEVVPPIDFFISLLDTEQQ